jgi:hypothetical protein
MDRLASIAAFENGGFSAGARGLNVATTTVSDQVRALENALGVRPRPGYSAVAMLPRDARNRLGVNATRTIPRMPTERASYLLMRRDADPHLPRAVNQIRVGTRWQFQYL